MTNLARTVLQRSQLNPDLLCGQSKTGIPAEDHGRHSTRFVIELDLLDDGAPSVLLQSPFALFSSANQEGVIRCQTQEEVASVEISVY